MSNTEKYNEVFTKSLGVSVDALNEDLKYQAVPTWDSVGHMSLIANLEDAFDLMLEMDDIIDFDSYHKGIQTLEKYGISFK